MSAGGSDLRSFQFASRSTDLYACIQTEGSEGKSPGKRVVSSTENHTEEEFTELLKQVGALRDSKKSN